MSMRGVPSTRDRCHVCNTWVVSRWGISDRNGTIAQALIEAYVRDRTKTGARRPAPFDKSRDSVYKDVLALVRKRFAYLAHKEGILVCWACAVPVVDQIHERSRKYSAADDGSSLRNDTAQTSPGTSTRPTRACTRTPLRLNPTEHDTEACIRACVTHIFSKRLLVGGLTCHFAPAAQPSRVPYGYGGIIGKSFEYRSGHCSQVYLVAPALDPGIRQALARSPQVILGVTTTGILSVDPRHATSHARIRQCPSPPAAPAKATLYPGSPGRPSSGRHHPGLTAIGDPTYCTARGRRTLAIISPGRPHYLHPPCDELEARWRLHSSTNIEPWA